MYREAMGVPRDYAESLYWCTRDAENGSADAQFAVGQYYFDRIRNGVRLDLILSAWPPLWQRGGTPRSECFDAGAEAVIAECPRLVGRLSDYFDICVW